MAGVTPLSAKEAALPPPMDTVYHYLAYLSRYARYRTLMT
jgi:hypothetical protein